MPTSPAPHSQRESYVFFGGPLGERFATLARVMSEQGHYDADGGESRDARMLKAIAQAHETALNRITTFTSPERWAIEKLVSVQETPRGPKHVMRRPRVDMDISYTAKGNLCVDWRPRYAEDNDAEYGDFRITEYETRKEAFQRPFFEAYYVPRFDEYVRSIKNAPPSKKKIMTEIARLAIECARDVFVVASGTCDVRLDGRLNEVLVPGTDIIDDFRYSNLASIKREEEAEKQRKLAERVAALRKALNDFEANTGISAQWFCQYVEERRKDGATYAMIAGELNDPRRPTEFTKGSVLSLSRDLSGKLSSVFRGWRLEGADAPAIPPKPPAEKVKAPPQPSVERLPRVQGGILSNVARRIAAQREREPKVTEVDYSTPDYSRLRRYANGSAVLAELGLDTIDDLVTAINERRAEVGRHPIAQGDFPGNKAAFDKLVREFGTYADEHKPR